MEISTIKQYITEAIKGEPLYKSRSLSQEAQEVKEKIQRQVDSCRLKTARVASWTTQKNDNISVTWMDWEAEEKLDEATKIQAFIYRFTQHGTVKDESGGESFRFVITIPRPVETKQNMAFDVPEISGVEDITTDRQRANGTVALYDNDTGNKYFLQSSGYVRWRKSNAKPGSPDTNLMAPGGGTPDEMVARVIKAIRLHRFKKFTRQDESIIMNMTTLKQHITEAIKGQPLYTIKGISDNARQINDDLMQSLITVYSVPKRYIKNSMWKNDDENTYSLFFQYRVRKEQIDSANQQRHFRALNSFSKECKKYGQVDVTQFGANDKLNLYYDYEIIVNVPITEDEQQVANASVSVKMTFDVPKIRNVKEITTAAQSVNGTRAFEDTLTGDKYALYASGYVRKTKLGKRPGSDDQILMKPQGGTADEMVQCMVDAIKRSRARNVSKNESITRSDLILALREIKSRR